MEWNRLRESLTRVVSKYRYALLILVLGLGLMLIPGKTEEAVTVETKPVASQTPQEQLADILSRLKGAGRVEVVLSIAQGEQVIYQTDQRTTNDAGGTDVRVETVILSGSDRGEEALVSQVQPPKYLGAVILCQGAADPAVRLALMDAVCKYTGLGADKVSILEMK